jgi:hypothetical protein
MSSGLPPIRGIEHQIDFIPGAIIPNQLAYRSNPEEINFSQIMEALAAIQGGISTMQQSITSMQ